MKIQKKEILDTIGGRIQRLRIEANLTQNELAKQLSESAETKISRETINQWENGSRDLKTSYLILLATAFDVSADYILGISPTNDKLLQRLNYLEEYQHSVERVLSELNSFRQNSFVV